jgi:hypothetical protein
MRLRSLCALYVVAAAVLAVVTVETLVQEACEGPPSDCGNCDCGAGRYPTLSASMAEPERFKRGKWLLTLAITGLVVWDVLFAERFRSRFFFLLGIVSCISVTIGLHCDPLGKPHLYFVQTFVLMRAVQAIVLLRAFAATVAWSNATSVAAFAARVAAVGTVGTLGCICSSQAAHRGQDGRFQVATIQGYFFLVVLLVAEIAVFPDPPKSAYPEKHSE